MAIARTDWRTARRSVPAPGARWRPAGMAAAVRRGLPGAGRSGRNEATRQLGVDEATRRMLLGFAVPLWIGAGLADWWRHRRTGIERTAGTRESLIHALMMTEAGVPLLLGLFFEPNAGVLAASAGGFAAHQATALWDVTYAEDRRRVTPLEQHLHSLLEVVPLMAAVSLYNLHWDQALALVGRGPERPRFRLERKRRPLPRGTRGALLAAIAVLGVAPYAEELWRCARVNRSVRATPAPEEPATPTLRIAGRA